MHSAHVSLQAKTKKRDSSTANVLGLAWESGCLSPSQQLKTGLLLAGTKSKSNVVMRVVKIMQ